MDLKLGNHLCAVPEDLVCAIFDDLVHLDNSEYLNSILADFCKGLDEMDSNMETNWCWLSEAMCKIINDICFKLTSQDFIDYIKDACNNVAFAQDARIDTLNKLWSLWKKIILFAANPPVLTPWADFSSFEDVKYYVDHH